MKAVLLRACMLFCRIFRSPDVEKANLHFLLLISIATIILSVVLCTLILCTPFFWVNNSKGLYPKTGPLHSIYFLSILHDHCVAGRVGVCGCVGVHNSPDS